MIDPIVVFTANGRPVQILRDCRDEPINLFDWCKSRGINIEGQSWEHTVSDIAEKTDENV